MQTLVHQMLQAMIKGIYTGQTEIRTPPLSLAKGLNSSQVQDILLVDILKIW
jgi:hypothetical protein